MDNIIQLKFPQSTYIKLYRWHRLLSFCFYSCGGRRRRRLAARTCGPFAVTWAAFTTWRVLVCFPNTTARAYIRPTCPVLRKTFGGRENVHTRKQKKRRRGWSAVEIPPLLQSRSTCRSPLLRAQFLRLSSDIIALPVRVRVQSLLLLSVHRFVYLFPSPVVSLAPHIERICCAYSCRRWCSWPWAVSPQQWTCFKKSSIFVPLFLF